MAKLIGNEPNQVPTNGDLGKLAFQEPEAVNITGGTLDSVTVTNLTTDGASLDGAVVINESGADVDFRIESDTDANAFFLDGTNGRVGIGTSSPDEKLDVRGTIQVGVDGTTAGLIRFMDSGSVTEEATISSDANGGLIFGGNSGPGELIFKTGSATERMRITSSGNVGIGTSSPSVPLHTVGSSGTVVQISAENTTSGAADTGPQIYFVGHAGTGPAGQCRIVSGKSNSTSGNTDAYMAFHTRNSGGINERMRIDSSGNVGIGTTSPAAILEVSGGSADYNPSATGTGLFHVKGGATSQYSGYIGISDAGMSLGHNGGGSRYLRFDTNETERMRIDSSGNVGIGTSSFSSKLTVSGGSVFAGSFSVSGEAYGPNTSSARGSTYNIAGTVVQITADYTNSVDTGALINFNAYNSTGGATGAFLGAVAGPTGNGPANLVFGRRTGTTSWSETMRINSSGYVGIGNSGPLDKLHVGRDSNDYIAIANSGSANYLSGIRWRFGSGQGVLSSINSSSSGGASYLTFNTGNSNTERMRIDGSGNVGIGTSSPFAKLDVVGANLTTFDSVATIRLAGTNAYNSGDAGSGINFSGVYNSSNNQTTFAEISGKKANTTDGDYNGVLTFGVRSSTAGLNIERMRITSSGNVGIGTSSPSTGLEVAGAFSGAGGIDITQNNGNGNGGRGPSLDFNISQSDDGSNIITGGRVRTNKDDGSPSNGAAHMVFSTSDASGTLTDRMRINSSGNVGIGTSSPGHQITINSANTSTNSLLEVRQGDVIQAYVGMGTDNRLRLQCTTSDTGVVAGNGKYIFFQQGSSERMRIDGSGNVGIGTSSPAQKLTIEGPNDNSNSSYAQLYIKGTGTYPLDIAGIALDSSGSNQSHIRFLNNGSPKFQIRYNEGDDAVDKLGFYSFTQAATLLSIDGATGNVGIGTSSPAYTLDVNGSFLGGKILSGQLSSNLVGGQSKYWCLNTLTTGQGYSYVIDFLAESYTVWNISRIYIRKHYASTSVTANFPQQYHKSGTTVSVVTVDVGGTNYLAIKVSGGDPAFSATLQTAAQAPDFGSPFVTSSGTVVTTHASY
jgi:hypothetical protein